MLTFNSLYSEAQEQVQDPDATSLIVLKRAINQGAKKFGAILNREWRTSEKTFGIVAAQQYYQMPENSIRMKWVTITIGNIAYPLTEIADYETWQHLNMRTSTTSTVPEYYYVRGNDEFGIWPIPSATTANAGRLNYERRMRDMVEADYTTGTVTMTINSATVTGSGTTFTVAMVGRWLNVTTATGDGEWYKISAFTSTTVITLENTYSGATLASLAYTIGELPDIPEEFHESLVDYACYRYYRRRRDTVLARDMKSAFDESLLECQANYSSKTGSQYFRPIRLRQGYVHHHRDYKVV